MTGGAWTRIAPGCYQREGWQLFKQDHPRFPDRPWVLDRQRSALGWVRIGRFHTLALAKRAATQQETQQP